MTKKYAILSVISLSHFIVDTACIMMVVNLTKIDSPAFIAVFLILLYDLIAFSTQPIFGYLSDRFNKPTQIAAIGCILTAVGLILYPLPYLAIVVSGIGNALFHVGGGVISLKLDPGKAWAPGIFISTGTMGVFIGTVLGKQAYMPLLLISLLVLLAGAHLFMKVPLKELPIRVQSNRTYGKVFSLALFLILFTVFIRSFTGMGITYTWKADIKLAFVMAICIMLGKALGGILFDRFGLIKVPMAGLILSVPCLIIGFTYPLAGFIGMLLFNLTMPVTLLLTTKLFPGYEGLGFGMTVLALSIGTVPVFSGLRLTSGFMIAVTILVSALALFLGDKLINKQNQNNALEE